MDLSLAGCVADVLSAAAAAMVAVAPAPGPARLPVSHVYLTHYTLNARRRAFQLRQLPTFGVNASIVTALDASQTDESVRCPALVSSTTRMIGANVSVGSSRNQLSATLKLYVALYDMYAHRWARALVLEDDALVRWEFASGLWEAVGNATASPPTRQSCEAGLPKQSCTYPESERLSLFFLGSYNVDGQDSFCCSAPPGSGAKLKPPRWRGHGLMPAVATIVARRGARHLLQSLPITNPIDMTLSDSRTPSGRQPGQWVSKPYAFVPSPELQAERTHFRPGLDAAPRRARRGQPAAPPRVGKARIAEAGEAANTTLQGQPRGRGELPQDGRAARRARHQKAPPSPSRAPSFVRSAAWGRWTDEI